jgi:DNA-binding response OmpR family regulator
MSARSHHHILVIEDTIDFAQYTMMALERYGFRAHHAADGQAALEYIQEHRPSAVLLDLNLPDTSGWQVLEEMKAKYGTIPVVVTTAYSDSANRVVGKLQDVYRYVVKPFSPQEIVAIVDEALGIKEH